MERAREQVQMLNALYKNAVVSIIKRYVGERDKQSAIMVAQDVFGAMKKGDGTPPSWSTPRASR